MRLNAATAGSIAPRHHFTGVVHSVFRRACNIELDGPRMLVLLAAELGNTPQGVRLETPQGFAFDRHVASGQAVGCRAGVLRVGRGALEVDLRHASTWHVDLSVLSIDLGQGTVAAAWRVAQQALGRSDSQLDRSLAGVARDRLDALAAATQAFDRPAAVTSMRRLIGTGIGLTPSGDDMAVGFLAGLCSTAGKYPRRIAFKASLAAAMRSAAGATGAISRSYLACAAEGQVSEPLAALAKTIAAGAPEGAVRAAVDRAVAVGGSSGREAVLGLLRGLEAWTVVRAVKDPGCLLSRHPVGHNGNAMEPVHG